LHVEDGVTVGETLAGARGAAGLSVDEVSERTRIRESIISSIEHDDFGALGGDLYVRGYLRALAGAVGLDPQTLIRDFDTDRSGYGTSPDATTPDLAAGDGRAVENGRGPLPASDAGDAGDGFSSLWWADDAVSDADPLPATQALPGFAGYNPYEEPFWGAAGGSAEPPWPSAAQPGSSGKPDLATPAGFPAYEPEGTVASSPQQPAGRSRRRAARRARPDAGPQGRARGWRWITTITLLGAVILGVIGVATDQIVNRVRSHGHSASASAGATPTVQPAVAAGSSPASLPASATPAATSPAGAATPKATPQPSPAVVLAVAQASAFGPNGVSDGDHPSEAGYVITPGASLPWHTDWYATAQFGMLKNGTGLLLDMGRTVTLTGVRIQLGSIRGADLQVRAGTVAALSAAPVVASANDTGGLLTLSLSAPARARYVIIWFTLLPPNGSGQYRATVYNVAVTGQV
jgi:hypothetical protein